MRRIFRMSPADRPPIIIDRRENPHGKNIGNLRRFMRRVRKRLKRIVDKSVRERKITDVDRGKKVSIPMRGIGEPQLRHAKSGGTRRSVFTGNKEFDEGERIPKPPRGGAGGRGRKGADSGEGEDEFVFAMSREEFLDIFFEDLELPDLVKRSLRETEVITLRRAGLTATGIETNLHPGETMKRSIMRRRALGRPRTEMVQEVENRIAEIEGAEDRSAEEEEELLRLQEEIELLRRKRIHVPFMDPFFDFRFRAFKPQPRPTTQAVMFCLMDVSGSMGEREKDLAKRFFVLLHLFLKRRYKKVEVVFVRHTHEAAEVDEETFFYSPETGGTVVSTALAEMIRVTEERYPIDRWNIYAAQASDGENFSGDSGKCTELLSRQILPMAQYFAYVEILDEREADVFRDLRRGSPIWEAYLPVAEEHRRLAMKRIARPSDIYPVFRELFEKRSGGARNVA